MSAFAPAQRQRTLVTPEDLPIELLVATAGSRLAAFSIDFLLMCLATALIAWLLMTAASGMGLSLGISFVAIFLLAHFVIWNGYFIFFELRWQGRTPGKRAIGIRVVSRHGGPLTSQAVIARNLLRELEFYLPVQALLVPEALYGPAPKWALFLAMGWIFIFMLLPFFNQDRARCGDLVAGTLVVIQPVAKLLEDQSTAVVSPAAQSAFQFTAAQVDRYGIHELQVLERVLRDYYGGGHQEELLRIVCDRIAKRIGWPSAIPDAQVQPFLQAYYKALRHRLEQGLLMGRRREHR